VLDKGKPVARRGRKAKGLSETAWLPKVTKMKRLTIALALSLLLIAAAAVPASAASLRVSTVAKQSGAHKVKFTTKLSRSARTVQVKVYRGSKLIKKLKARKVAARKYATTWTGSSVKAGTYTYRVTAKVSSTKRTVRGKVKVRPVNVTPLANSRWIGMYVPGAPSSMAPIEAIESMDGTHTGVVHFFMADSESFPTSRVQAIADHGSTPLVTLEFWSIGGTGLSAISNGSKDAYLNKFAAAARDYGGEVWVRPLHEMNGDWYPWGGPVGSNSASKYIAAWRHIHDVFAAAGATNVKLVWCPNNDSVPNTSANAIGAYWPGESYVDYAALDGYNAGNTQSWSSWRSFEDTFASSYDKVASLTSKPMFIAETSSLESGGSKAEWITDMFSVIRTRFPRLVGVVWFNASLDSDWRFETSSSSQTAFRNALSMGF
jgi:beta-mannanase